MRTCTCGVELTPSQAKYCSKECRLDGLRARKHEDLGEYVPPVIPPVGMMPVPPSPMSHSVEMSPAWEADVQRGLDRAAHTATADWRRPQKAQDAMESWHRKPRP